MNKEMASEVREFAREIFTYFKEFVYSLGICCDCKYCFTKKKTKSSRFIPHMAEVILDVLIHHRKAIRNKIRLFAARSTKIVLGFDDQLEIWRSVIYYFRSANVHEIPSIFAVISEVFLYRFLKMRHTLNVKPCVPYVQGACSCFVFVYENILRTEHPDLIIAFKSLVKQRCVEMFEEKRESSSPFISEEYSNKISTWPEISFIFDQMSDKKLLLRSPSVYLFTDPIEVRNLHEHIKKLSGKYKELYPKLALLSKTTAHFSCIPMIDIFLSNTFALSNKGPPPSGLNKKEETIRNSVDFMVKDIFKKKINEVSLDKVIPNARTIIEKVFEESKAKQCQSSPVTQDQSCQAKTTESPANSIKSSLSMAMAQRFARKLFFFLKKQFNLKEDCECEECLNGNKTYSIFTDPMGATVMILSLTRRNFFRARLKTVVLKHYNPILKPDEEKKIWEEISSLSRGLMDEYKNGIAYVLSLISEAYLFQYLRLRQHVDSNPCIDYLKASRLCFEYVYENVLQNDQDFVHSLEFLVVDKTYDSKSVHLLMKMEQYLKNEKCHKENNSGKYRKKKQKKRNLNVGSIMEEFEPKFVTSCEFVDNLTVAEKCNISSNLTNLNKKYIKFYKRYVSKYLESSVLFHESSAWTDRKSKLEIRELETIAPPPLTIPEKYAVNLILDQIVYDILAFFYKGRFILRPWDPSICAEDIFFCVKKLNNLNCSCKRCQNYKIRICSTLNPIVAVQIFVKSINLRKFFRNKLQLGYIWPMRKPYEGMVLKQMLCVCEDILKIDNTNKGNKILLCLCVISEICLYRYQKLRDFIDPSVCYFEDALKCFKEINKKIFHGNFLKDLESPPFPQTWLLRCQNVLFNLYNYVTGLNKNLNYEEIDWSWLYLMKNEGKIPHDVVMACQYSDPLENEEKEFKDRLKKMSKRHKKLHKKHGRARSCNAYFQVFPGECTRVYEGTLRTRKLSV